MIFGYLTFLEFQRVSSGRDTDLDCIIDLGAYKFCNVTQRLSLDTSILLLMTQALVSRILLPGISNFVNASVRRLHHQQQDANVNGEALSGGANFVRSDIQETIEFATRG